MRFTGRLELPKIQCNTRFDSLSAKIIHWKVCWYFCSFVGERHNQSRWGFRQCPEDILFYPMRKLGLIASRTSTRCLEQREGIRNSHLCGAPFSPSAGLESRSSATESTHGEIKTVRYQPFRYCQKMSYSAGYTGTRTTRNYMSPRFEWQIAVSQSARADEIYNSFDHHFYATV